MRARAYAAEVDAVRTVKGVVAGAPIGPVLRAELWQQRYQGATLSLHALAQRFQAMARDEGVPVEEIAERYATETVRPARQRAGERLANLVVERPDWVRPEHLVAAIEPPENGTPNEAYLRAVLDANGREWLLVTSFDGSEPMKWQRDDAGLKAAAEECLARVRAVTDNPTAYEAWLAEQDATDPDAAESPWTKSMSDADFLAHSGEGGMHLV
ncbi:hypothetical protein [Nocardioides pinisoli]|uniref:Uncharacterized protein n=1 Tax=Nocardioides pinisoli TaxID=2950279 RepID=A0ABT1KRH5_9ACTN|nr:hypothetical protein [Nocardioides pinisoli]MCP3420334.1 hypothetical protein [Nocardioides pinisoli]